MDKFLYVLYNCSGTSATYRGTARNRRKGTKGIKKEAIKMNVKYIKDKIKNTQTKRVQPSS